jgi:hypothetical protein
LSAGSTGRFYPPPPREIRLVLIAVKRLSRPQGHTAVGRIKSMKNPKGAIANRARDLPASSAVRHLTAPPCAPDTLCGTSYYVTPFYRRGGRVAGIMATGWTILRFQSRKGQVFFTKTSRPPTGSIYSVIQWLTSSFSGDTAAET